MLRSLMAASVAVMLAAPAAAAEEVNFGIISTETTRQSEDDLGSVSGGHGRRRRQLKHQTPSLRPDYAGVIEAMRFKKVQVAWFGNKSAMEARPIAPSGEVFAQTVDRKDGNPGYWSHIIVHKDSPYQTLDDVLKCDGTLDFGIGDPNSTSRLPGAHHLHLLGHAASMPKECFKTVR